jgi:predicted RND superfamily exporter protein
MIKYVSSPIPNLGFLVLMGFVVAVTLNATVLMQIIYYWNVRPKPAKKAEGKKKSLSGSGGAKKGQPKKKQLKSSGGKKSN